MPRQANDNIAHHNNDSADADLTHHEEHQDLVAKEYTDSQFVGGVAKDLDKVTCLYQGEDNIGQTRSEDLTVELITENPVETDFDEKQINFTNETIRKVFDSQEEYFAYKESQAQYSKQLNSEIGIYKFNHDKHLTQDNSNCLDYPVAIADGKINLNIQSQLIHNDTLNQAENVSDETHGVMPIDNNDVNHTIIEKEIQFDSVASGAISLADGSESQFMNVKKIHWDKL